MESEGVADPGKTDGDTITRIGGGRSGGFRYRGYERDTNDGDPRSASQGRGLGA